MSTSTSGTSDTRLADLRELVDGLPNLSGSESTVDAVIRVGHSHPVYSGRNGVEHGTLDHLAIDAGRVDSAFAIALHMHQPLIPANGSDLHSAGIIGNLQYMAEHPDIGDNHNAGTFRWCYQRMGEYIPQLLAEGKRPRVMLEYSGTLLYGLRQMGAGDVLDSLRRITTDHNLRDAVEWLGCPWGHAVAPSTPVQDYRLHVRAWQHHFAAIFGTEALGRVRGFSPSEMALPNQPDIAYEFIRTLTDCGFQWVLVQEHTVEQPDGRPLEQRYLPQRLVCRNSHGDTAEITAIVKTQGSDTKLVAQMQPYYEARGMAPVEYQGRRLPPLVTQIADGENGGVMMNEFPAKYQEVIRECSGSRTPAVTVTEYLEAIELRQADLPPIQPVQQHRIWSRMQPGDGPERLAAVIEEIGQEDDRFGMDGGSWTNDISWVHGYENVLAPMEKASSLFHQKVLARSVPTDDPRYRAALFHLLAAETSCYRYWGQGTWTDYGAELSRRAIDLANQFNH